MLVQSSMPKYSLVCQSLTRTIECFASENNLRYLQLTAAMWRALTINDVNGDKVGKFCYVQVRDLAKCAKLSLLKIFSPKQD